MPALAEDSVDLAQERKFAEWAGDTLGWREVRLETRLAGGNANVTWRGRADGRPFVLRRPPADSLSDRAADGIAREAKLLEALDGTGRTPRLHAFSDDRSIFGVPFAVIDFVPGVAIGADLPPGYAHGPDTVSELGRELMRAIASVHKVSADRWPVPAGQGAGFLERQISRWRQIRSEQAVRELDAFETIGRWLADNVPAQRRISIIHGDYHLDNCLSAIDRPHINAIIDWELGTVGDALIDVGLALMFWQRDSAEPIGFGFVQAVSNRPDVASAAELAELWSEKTGWGTEHLDYYRVFAFWRLAAIVEGAYRLYKRGKIDGAYAQGLERDVPALLREASEILDRGA